MAVIIQVEITIKEEILPRTHYTQEAIKEDICQRYTLEINRKTYTVPRFGHECRNNTMFHPYTLSYILIKIGIIGHS